MRIKELLDMYLYYYSKHREKGLLDDITVKLGHEEMVESYDKIITEKYIVKLYHVTELPTEMQISLETILRQNKPKGTVMDVYTYMEQEYIDWESPYMKKVKKAWKDEIDKNPTKINKNKLNDKNDYEKSEKSNNALDSWNLVNEKAASKRDIVKSETVAVVRYYRPISMSKLIKLERDFIKSCTKSSVKVTTIDKDIEDVYRTLLPTSILEEQPVKAYMTLIDENVAMFKSYLSGKLDGSEVFMGMNIDNGTLVFNDLTNTRGGALSIMMVASTGKGKSFYVKFIIDSFIASGIKNIIIWDKDGEYEYTCKKISAPIIKLGKVGGKYFNTMVIDTEDIDGFSRSIQETLSIFEILCDVEKGMTSNEKYIFNLAYTKVFEDFGISQVDNSTWVKSKNLNYQLLYKAILSLKDNIAKDIEVEYNNMIRNLYKYFDSNGINFGLFKDCLNIEDILFCKHGDQPLILCINMQSNTKSDDSSSKVLLDKLKSLTMSYLTDRIVDYNKSLDELTVLIVEELQRHVYNTKFIQDLCDIITGGRKRNLIPIINTNALNSIVNGGNPQLKDIVDNIDTVIVGSLKANAVDLVLDNFNLKDCKDILTKITDMSERDLDSKWNNAFLMKNKKELAVIKAMVPEHIRNTKMFKTRS